MTGQPLFYKQPVVLNREQHGTLGVDASVGFAFARETHAVGVTAVEFEKAAYEYPIVFTEEQGAVYPVVVLGLRQNENLFVSDDGRWQAGYIPAYVRRYPFILANQEGSGETFTVCVDQAYPGWSEEAGERLFQDDGSESPFLEKSMSFLREFQLQHERTREFSAHLRALDLLEPMQANVAMDTGQKFQLGGFLVVNRTRLMELADERLSALVKTGQLELIYRHLFSLANFSRLVERMGQEIN